MKKILVISTLFVLLVRCNNNLNEVPIVECDDLEAKIDALEVKLNDEKLKIKALEKDIQFYLAENEAVNVELNLANESIKYHNIEDDNFRSISYITLQFARARTNGDMETLKTLVSKNVKIYEENEDIWSEFSDSKINELLHFQKRKKYFYDMHIIYYQYDEYNNTIDVQTEEYFVNDDKEISGIGFVHITFIKEDDEWKINSFYYDI